MLKIVKKIGIKENKTFYIDGFNFNLSCQK